MANAPRDENQVAVALGSFGGTPKTLMIENATGYLKVVFLDQALSATSVAPTVAARDENGVHTACGQFNGAAKPILIENSSGYVRAVLM